MVGPATNETYICVPRPVASEERWKAARWEGVREGRRGISAELAPTARVAWVRSDKPITFPTSAFTAAMVVSLEDFHFELNEYWYRKMLSSSRSLCLGDPPRSPQTCLCCLVSGNPCFAPRRQACSVFQDQPHSPDNCKVTQ